MQQPKVPAGDAGNGCNRLVIGKVGGVQLQAEFPPVAGEDEGQFIPLQRAIVVCEADPAVELRIAFQFSFQARHPDQDNPDPGPVEDIAHMFKTLRRKSFGLIDYQNFDSPLSMAFRNNHARIERQIDATFCAGYKTA